MTTPDRTTLPTAEELDTLLARCGSVTFSLAQVAILRAAVMIADDTARSDIETECIDIDDAAVPTWEIPVSGDFGERDRAWAAANYLMARQKINQHPNNPERFDFHGHDPIPPDA